MHMKLNKSQRMLLEYLKDTKETGPSLLLMYKMCWKCNLLLVVVIMVLILSDIYLGVSNQSLIFYGSVIGAVIRDLGIKRKQKINWPVQNEIINWEKVDSLLNEKV